MSSCPGVQKSWPETLMCLGVATPALPALPGKAALVPAWGSAGRDDGEVGRTWGIVGLRAGWHYSVAALMLCSPGSAAAFSFLCSERKKNLDF